MQPIYPQQMQYMPQPQQVPMNMYQPQGAPQYYQQPQPQMMVQPQMAQQPQISEQDVAQALMSFTAQAANQTPVGAYLYQRSSQSGWRDGDFMGAVAVGTAFALLNLRSAPGLQIQQAMQQAIPDAYEIMFIAALSANPNLVQNVPQPTLQSLLQNLPRLQQQLNTAMSMVGKPSMTLQIPGYQVIQQAPNIVPMQQQQFQMQPGMMPQAYQQPSLQQQYGMPMQGTQPLQVQGAQPGSSQNLGYSNARAVVPPPAGENHLGMKPIDIGTLNVGSNRVQQQADEDVGIRARQVSFGSGSNIEPLIKSQPVQQPQQPQQPVNAMAPTVFQEMPPVVPPAGWNNGVLESHSTPTLAQAIQTQLAQPQPAFDASQYPSDINFDAIAALSTEDENALFNPPADQVDTPMPSMQELFAPTFGANKTQQADPFAFMAMNQENPTYTHAQPQEEVVDLTAGRVGANNVPQSAVLSEDGLPDGWLFTEQYYDAPSADFYNVMRKAKRHSSCPWPIGYDRRFCTRLYRYMEDGSIEQKLVGVPMDRLKHDISLLDTPVPTDEIYKAEMADFGPLNVMGVADAVKIVKTPDVTPEVINEKLGDKSIYVVDKPIIALSRQEAILLAGVKVKPLMDNLEKGTHGFETQIREMRLITSHPDLKNFLENDVIKNLTIDSEAADIMELSEAIRTIRNDRLLPDRCLRKVTEYMRETINTMLYADYGYAGELELTDDQPFEDELVEFVMYMNKSEDDLDVLNRIHKNWANVRSRLCTILTGKALESAQQQLARRYALSDEDRDTMLDQMTHAVLLQVAYSITTMARTTKQLRANDNQPAFVTMRSDRPYLHQLMTEIKKRGKDAGATLSKHIIITSDGVELGFSQAGLGNGDTFPTYYIK